MPEPSPSEAAAEEFAAAGPPEPGLSAGEVPSPASPAEEPAAPDRELSDQAAQSAASDALDELTMPTDTPAAPPGEDVEAAEAVAPPADQPDYKDLYLRASADMDNVRKRARRDVGAAEARGIAKLAKELLPAIDNLERALQAATPRSAAPTQGTGEALEGQGDDVDLLKGIRLVQAEFAGALTRVGIAIEDPKGDAFDPHRHEALAQTPTEGTPPGVVVEVYQPGYVHGETVLRAARVVVSS